MLCGLHLFFVVLRMIRRLVEAAIVVAVYLGFGAGLELFFVTLAIVLLWRKNRFGSRVLN